MVIIYPLQKNIFCAQFSDNHFPSKLESKVIKRTLEHSLYSEHQIMNLNLLPNYYSLLRINFCFNI